MFNQILEAVFDGVKMCTSFSVFMMLCCLANTVLGAVIAAEKKEFEWGILFSGMIRSATIIAGIIFLSAGISGISKLMDIYGILTEYSDSFKEVSTLGIAATLITLSYTVYGKQAIAKIRALGDLKEEDIIQIEPMEGWERRGK